MAPADRRKDEPDPIAEHAVTDDHRSAAARERERSQSRTKFFTPVAPLRPTEPEHTPTHDKHAAEEEQPTTANESDTRTESSHHATEHAPTKRTGTAQHAASTEHATATEHTAPPTEPRHAGTPSRPAEPRRGMAPVERRTAEHHAPADHAPEQHATERQPTDQHSTEQHTQPHGNAQPRGWQPRHPRSHLRRGDLAHRIIPGIRRQRQETQTGIRPAAPLAENATYGPELPGESQVQLVLDLALRIGEVQMASGAGAADTTETIQAITTAYGLPHCEVDVIFSSITVSVHRGTDVNPITAVRLLRTRGTDYTRLEAADKLVQRIVAGNGKFRPYEASAELDKITRARHPYPRWVATMAWGGMAGSIAVLISGDRVSASGIALLALISAVISAFIDRVGRMLNKRLLPTFFQQLVGGFLATLMALVIVHYGKPAFAASFGQLGDQLIVGAAITVLLSGLSVVSTVQDAITGYYVTAAGRTVEITLISAGLIAGVVIAVRVGAMVGLTAGSLGPPLTSSVYRLPVWGIAGAAAAAFFALASYARKRTVAVSAAAGALGGLSYGTLLTTANSPLTASAVAAIIVGFAGGVLTRRLRVPPVIVAVAGLTPLLPGFSTYRALFELAVGKNVAMVQRGAVDLVVAVTIALALGAGVVLGEFLAQPVRQRLGRLQRRFFVPRLTAPQPGNTGVNTQTNLRGTDKGS